MKKNRRVQNVLEEFRRDKGAIVAVVILVFLILLSIFAFLIPISPEATDIGNKFAPPSLAHLFGTDKVGRDYLIRCIYGGRVSLSIGFLSMLTSVFMGVTVGTIAGYFGGIVDSILMRIVDILSAIPWMILVTVMTLLLNGGFTTIILVIGLFTWMPIARLMRAETLSIKQREYVIYSKFIGTPSIEIIFRHIIPAVFPTMIVSATMAMSNAIMTESALSFLGLGIQEPMSSWGKLLKDAEGYLQTSVHLVILPGILIILTVFAINKIGNVMRVFAEPKVTAGDK